MNCNDLYDEIIHMINDEPIGIIEELYCDEQNTFYEKFETFSDTNTDISSDDGYSSEYDMMVMMKPMMIIQIMIMNIETIFVV